jgi:hypothetical protein
MYQQSSLSIFELKSNYFKNFLYANALPLFGGGRREASASFEF